MSHFRCPLCGKQASVKNYSPEDFDDDISVVVVRGLGRGKGFETVGEFPVESYPELLHSLKERVERLNRILGLGDEKLIAELRKENKELIYRLDNEAQKTVALEEELEELDIDFVVQKIGELTGEDYSDVNAAVDSLIQWYTQVLMENNSLNDEYVEELEYINEKLPEEHPEYDDLHEAVEALIQVYEDELEELEDSL